MTAGCPSVRPARRAGGSSRQASFSGGDGVQLVGPEPVRPRRIESVTRSGSLQAPTRTAHAADGTARCAEVHCRALLVDNNQTTLIGRPCHLIMKEAQCFHLRQPRRHEQIQRPSQASSA